MDSSRLLSLLRKCKRKDARDIRNFYEAMSNSTQEETEKLVYSLEKMDGELFTELVQNSEFTKEQWQSVLPHPPKNEALEHITSVLDDLRVEHCRFSGSDSENIRKANVPRIKALEALRKLVEKDLIPTLMVPALVQVVLGWVSDEDINRSISLLALSIIENTDDDYTLQAAVVFWYNTMPDVARVELIRIWDSDESQKNIRRALLLIGENFMGNNSIKINIGDNSTVDRSFIVGNVFNQSFNQIKTANIHDELKDSLNKLVSAVEKMCQELPKSEAEQAARDLETLTTEATSKKPRRKWWELSVEGLKSAAKNVGEIGKRNVSSIMRQL